MTCGSCVARIERALSAIAGVQRVTVNLLISPIPRFDLGAEILWGRRHNKDGASAIARQVQFAWIYKF